MKGATDPKLAVAGLTTVIAEPVLALAHQGAVGVIVGLGAGALAYVIADEVERARGAAGEEAPSSPPAAPSGASVAPSGEPSLLYRMLNGKSVRGERVASSLAPGSKEIPRAQSSQDGPWIPPRFELESVLDVVHAFNAKGFVYFGNSEDGAIALPLNDMYHVIDISSSGKGKSNRFRLAMMQMVGTCQTYYINPFAANVKAVNDAREIEVWKPIYDRLANQRPVKEGSEIGDLMQTLVAEVARRNAQEEQGDFSWRMKPIFIFIDELPEVFARCPEAIKLLDKIGRGGRQFCVFAWVASQTALTQDIGQSTAAQAQYKTRIYGGGDKTSCSRLMKGTIPGDTERILQTSGAGLSVMLAEGMDSSAFVRAPLVTNEGLFQFFRLPPFRKVDWLTSSSAPSQASGVSPSLTPTSKQPDLRLVKGANEGERRGNEGGAGDEGAMVEFTEREQQIIQLFVKGNLGISAIARELEGVTSGAGYQKVANEVTEALRKYILSKGA